MSLQFPHTYFHIAGKFILLPGFFLSALFVFPQDEKPSRADTTVADSSKNKSLYEDDNYEEGRAAANKEEYFWEKSVYQENMDSFQLRKIPDSLVRAMKADDAFWYANAEKEKEKGRPLADDISQKESFFSWLTKQLWFKVLIRIIIIGGFIAVMVWYLAISNMSIFRRASKTISDADVNAETENIFEIDYQKEIEKAIQIENYRLAVRLLFLRLLRNLAQKNIIQYKQERTNFDYLLQLHNTAYYKDFFRLTRNYEYSWYGKFDVSVRAFTIMKNDFDKFDQKIN